MRFFRFCVVAVSISLGLACLTAGSSSAGTAPGHPAQFQTAAKIGFAKVQPSIGSPTPAGVAVLGFNAGSALVTETGVPASTPTQSGRVFVEVGVSVNTAVVFANPEDHYAVISFHFTDPAGLDFGHGSFTLAGKRQVVAFLSDQPFNGRAPMFGTFTFYSSAPVSAMALRRLTNERGDFVLSSLPFSTPGTPGVSGRIAVPHFVSEGWYTQLVLLNPTNSLISGTTEFLETGPKGDRAIKVRVGDILASNYRYAVPPRSAIRLAIGSSSDRAALDSIRIVTAQNSSAPVGLATYSYRPNGTVLSEASVMATKASSILRLYVESSGTFGEVGSIDTGITIENPSRWSATVRLDVTGMDGVDTGLTVSLNIPPGGQISNLASGLIPGLPDTFQGIVRATSSAPVTVSALRMRYNERGDVLTAAFPAWDDETPPGQSATYFLHVAVGGGFRTRLVLVNATPSALGGRVSYFFQDGAQCIVCVYASAD